MNKPESAVIYTQDECTQHWYWAPAETYDDPKWKGPFLSLASAQASSKGLRDPQNYD